MSLTALALLLAAGALTTAAILGRCRRRRLGGEPGLDRIIAALPHNSILVTAPDGPIRQQLLTDLARRLEERPQEVRVVRTDLAGVRAEELFETLDRDATRQLGLVPTTGCQPCTARRLGRRLRTWLAGLEASGGGSPAVVLVIDHLDQVDGWDVTTRQRLRSLFMGVLGHRLVTVAAAAAIDRSWTEPGSPWFNFFSEVEIE